MVDTLSDWRSHGFWNGYPALVAAIGLHYGTVGGVQDSGCHSESTVIGDVVNVAQRLETLAKSLDAYLVISSTCRAAAESASARPVDVFDLSRSAGRRCH
ncbi:hypothetical protein SO078_26590 (plasmid) [Sinorhizobium meliloti]|uniref:hypothetical protein n=1 Tax=Sinorhizobium sp. KGO-5 TaxID=1470810 RepID=UPI002D769BEF|nr:hypothetical protein [Sinorhizobium meliloti]WRQ71822.1 hypothetical protein SO078_26590 [Sinorhizobium meliloti]